MYPLISGHLPKPKGGKYKHIAHAYINSKATKPRIWDTPTFLQDNGPVFKLENVSYSLYYPANTDWVTQHPSRKENAYWNSRPIEEISKGYNQFLEAFNRPTWPGKPLSVYFLQQERKMR